MAYTNKYCCIFMHNGMNSTKMQTLSYTVQMSELYSGVAVLSFNLGHDS